MSRSNITSLEFDAIAIEGGLLPAEWLAKVAQLAVPLQKLEDYAVPKGLNLRDELGRYWHIARAHWGDFQLARNAHANGDAHAASQRLLTALLRDVFGASDLSAVVSPIVIAERNYPVSANARGGRLPLVIAAFDQRLDAREARFGDAGRQRSAFGLLQDYLNASDDALWGIVSNGLSLRLVRDNASLTRPAWVEADLERIFSEDRFPDFSLLWLLIHASRFGEPSQLALQCPLEAWREASREQGTRAREQLRTGVEEALAALGQGFVSELANDSLRAKLASGQLNSMAYFQQLLRLVYRLIFLLTIEERGLLHPPGSEAIATNLYADGYSLRRLRERARKRRTYDRHRDLWQSLKPVFAGLATGQPLLALPALGGLFAIDQCPDLDDSELSNAALLAAVFKLGWLRSEGNLSRINWRDMGPEEFGSVYESLLELVPKVEGECRQFVLDRASGNARKTTASYYTHDVLVEFLLDTALEPIVSLKLAEAASSESAESALLSITVIDPACGSGHFLLAAARRLAHHLARVRADGTPSGDDFRHALRDVVVHCVYGVDRNPMALELARTALWLETMTPDLPLGFVDHHLACGDACLGLMDLRVVRNGIPNVAFKSAPTDDNEACKRLVLRNRPALRQLESSTYGQIALDLSNNRLQEAMQSLEMAPDDSLQAIADKREKLEEMRKLSEVDPLKLAADMYVAAFLAEKSEANFDRMPTSVDLLHLLTGNGDVDPAIEELTREVAERARVLHWPLAFPGVFAKGGFDLVLGNPPWETMSPDIKEFFSAYIVDIGALSPEQQEKAVTEQLLVPAVAQAWHEHCRDLYGAVRYMKHGGRYTRYAEGNLGKGDFNVYRQFVELALDGTKPGGYAAQVVPENFYNGANAAGIRTSILSQFDLRLLFGFENHRKVWFNGVDSRAKFCMYVARKQGVSTKFTAAFSVRNPADLAVAKQQPLSVDVSLVREFSPDAFAVMEFSNQYEIDICRKIYEAFPHFGEELTELPYREYMREVDMGNDNELFERDVAGYPVYQGSMVTHHDYRAKGYVSGHGRNVLWEELAFGDLNKSIRPQWYIAEGMIPAKCRNRVSDYRIGFCDIARADDQRSLMAALIPPMTVCGHKVPTLILLNGTRADYVYWLGVANSLALDFIVRMKVSLTMSMSLMDTLPFPRTASNNKNAAVIAALAARLSCAGPEMLSFLHELTAEGSLAGQNLAPAKDEETRRRISAEIDARVARYLFRLTRDEVAYVLDPRNVLGQDTTAETFRSLRDQEIRAFGEYRTQRLVLHEYDRMVRADASGVTYQSLSPPVSSSAAYSPHGVVTNESEAICAGFVLTLIRQSQPNVERQAITQALAWFGLSQEVRERASSDRMRQLMEGFPVTVMASLVLRLQDVLRSLEDGGAIRVEQQGTVFSADPDFPVPNWVQIEPSSAELAALLLEQGQATQHTPSGEYAQQTTSRREA